jgi:CRISPR/Cas system CMR subunit Cmr6 (Cas7 group RAMP superfamily)
VKCWEKANDKAEEYVKQKEQEGEERLKKEGRKTQKEEAFRIGGKALRAVLMQLLAELVREIIAKLVKWFKSTNKALDTLLNNLKEAIHSFIGKMKTHQLCFIFRSSEVESSLLGLTVGWREEAIGPF